MKKIILITLLSLSLQGYSQKIVYILNFSSYNVQIAEINTITTNLGIYPSFKNNTGLITIPAGQSYTLTNSSSSTKFPFVSVGNTPQINSWIRRNSATSSTTVASTTAYITGATQKFNFIKFQVGTNGNLGGGNLGQGYATTLDGSGWQATYDPPIIDPLNPNFLEYTIVLYDN
jgi:hypothetical protein